MSDEDRERLIGHHRAQLELRETEDLAAIWRRQDRSEWTTEAFEAIRRILIERTGEVPVVDERDSGRGSGSIVSETDAELWHSPDKLVRVATYARVLSWVNVAASVVYAILLLINGAGSYDPYNPGSVVFTLMSGVLSVIQSLFPFVVLQAISEGIYLFMDIEANTRRARH